MVAWGQPRRFPRLLGLVPPARLKKFHSNNDRSKRVPKDKFSNQNVQTQVFKKVPHKCANMCQQVVFVVVVVLVVVVVVVVCACVCVLSNKVFQHNTHTILQKRFYTFKTFSNVFVLILQKTNQA